MITMDLFRFHTKILSICHINALNKQERVMTTTSVQLYMLMSYVNVPYSVSKL